LNRQLDPGACLDLAILVEHVLPVESLFGGPHLSADPFSLSSSEEENTDDVSSPIKNHELPNRTGRLEPSYQSRPQATASREGQKRSLQAKVELRLVNQEPRQSRVTRTTGGAIQAVAAELYAELLTEPGIATGAICSQTGETTCDVCRDSGTSVLLRKGSDWWACHIGSIMRRSSQNFSTVRIGW
jgi:hypothetical protein